MNMMKSLFLVKELRNKLGDLHFRRWRVLNSRWFNIYIHQFYRADQDKHCHDHPWSFVSFVLWGGYALASPSGNNKHKREYTAYHAPAISFNKDKDFHKVEMLFKTPTITLVITGPQKRDWGYWVDGSWVHHKEYREKKRSGEYEKDKNFLTISRNELYYDYAS